MNRSPYWFLTIPYRGAFCVEEIVKGWFLKHAEAGRFRYAKFALEVGETTEYKHIQAYVVLSIIIEQVCFTVINVLAF